MKLNRPLVCLSLACLPLVAGGALADPAAPSAGHPNTSSLLLRTLPEGVHSLAYCDSFAALRERAERNAWAGRMGGPVGNWFFDDLVEFDDWRLPSQSGLREFAGKLDGECLVFATLDGAALMTSAKHTSANFFAELKSFAPALAEKGRVVEVAGGRLTLPPLPPEPEGDSTGVGRIDYGGPTLRALLEHPEVYGIFEAATEERLVALVQDCLARLRSDQPSSVAEHFLAARRATGPTGGIELFVDFSYLADVSRDELRDAAEGIWSDPVDLLGLDEGVNLYVSFDLFPGERIDVRGHLAIPPKSRLAKLADTFTPLAPDWLANVPAGAWGAFGMQWDFVKLSELAREMMEEQTKEMVDQSVGAANATVGLDVEERVLRQLDGSLILHMLPIDPDDPTSDVEWKIMRRFGLSLGLREAGKFSEAFDELIGATPAESSLDLLEVDGHDIYTVPELGGDFDGGFGVVGGRLLVSIGRDALLRQVRAIDRRPDASLGPDDGINGPLGGTSGACAAYSLDLVQLIDLIWQTESQGYAYLETVGEEQDRELDDWEQYRLDKLKSLEAARASLPSEAYWVFSLRRVHDGFDLAASAR